jgi:formate dehydrogenase major subunit
MVERFCGVPRDIFLKVAEIFSSASGPEKTAAICYAVGWTQHSKGVQIIRTASILQLLLGNIGRPGGGILALRGHASIQGSTDIPTLYDILPGYLPMPFLADESRTLDAYIRKHSSRTGLWSGFDKYFISLMKAYYGDGATRENEWGFHWLPRITGDHSHFGYWLDMADGKLEGLFVMGQNPAVGASNGRLERKPSAKLKWLVVRDMVETETASFWYASPEVERGELSPETIATEVFLFPAAGTAEKAGTFTNTQRLLQHREKAVDPPGDARSDTWFMVHLGRRLKEMAQQDHDTRNDGLRALTWDYTTEGPAAEPQVEDILREINGWSLPDRKQLGRITDLKSDGSTACGAWIYCGVFPEENRPGKSPSVPEQIFGLSFVGAITTAASFTTVLQRAPTESPGVSVRSSSGGTTSNRNGQDSTTQITTRKCLPILQPTFTTDMERRHSAVRSLLHCIQTASDGYMSPADSKTVLCPRTTSRSNR